MSDEKVWNNVPGANMVEGPGEKIYCKEILRPIKPRKAVRLSEINAEIISAIGKERFRVLIEICQRLFDRKVMQDKSQINTLLPIF